MCGFVAICKPIGSSPVTRASLEQATQVLKHRGPDDQGYLIESNIGLGFRRLAILDLSNHSHQPFEDIDKRLVIVFNGEIYNYLELREELRSKGHSFRSDGDTEVLITAYKEWGPSCVNRLNGMWAFIIYDRLTKTLFGSRDRFGVKPLFTTKNSQMQMFASEIKALFASTLHERQLNVNCAASYLADGELSDANADRTTFFEGVHEVPAGHCFSIDPHGHYNDWRFWELPFEKDPARISPVSKLQHLLHDSVKLRLRSDVPIGVCLSGGIDSTAIISLVSKELGRDRQQDLNAFSFIEEAFDESKEVEATIAATNATLHRLTGNAEEFLGRLKEVLWFQDEPIHSLNVLVSFELYRMAAASGVKVILNGQGADESWAGYPSYFDNHWYGLLKQRSFLTFCSEINAHTSMHGSSSRAARKRVGKMLVRQMLRRFGFYRRLSANRARLRSLQNPWFKQDLFTRPPNPVPDYEELDLKSVLRRSIEKQPLPLYLRVEDRNSMAHSIETRLPFLDYRLVTLAAKTSPHWLLSGGWNKFALREATKGLIPEMVRRRKDKMGFPVASRQWFAGPMYSLVRDVISSQSARENGYFCPGAILADLDRHRQGEIDCSKQLLRVLQFQLLLDGGGPS